MHGQEYCNFPILDGFHDITGEFEQSDLNGMKSAISRLEIGIETGIWEI